MSAGRSVAAALLSAGIARAARRLPEPSTPGWQRINYRGRSVSLSGGLATAVGALGGSVIAGPHRRAALMAGGAALAAGGYDDLFAPRAESTTDKGLTGHLQAMRSGRVSGGTVKVAVIGIGGLVAAGLLPNRPRLVSAALIAGAANLVNLFDLRPGRAAKVTLAVSSAFGFSGESAAIAGAVAAGLPDDLGERTMLGDLGANTVGALLGLRLATASTPVRIASLVVIGGLTLASERVSFSRVIADVPVLRRLDELGRGPADDPREQ